MGRQGLWAQLSCYPRHDQLFQAAPVPSGRRDPLRQLLVPALTALEHSAKSSPPPGDLPERRDHSQDFQDCLRSTLAVESVSVPHACHTPPWATATHLPCPSPPPSSFYGDGDEKYIKDPEKEKKLTNTHRCIIAQLGQILALCQICFKPFSKRNLSSLGRCQWGRGTREPSGCGGLATFSFLI